MNFKTFNYDKKLTLDKNISRLSTYFASKNIIFFQKIEDNNKFSLINKYLKLENNENYLQEKLSKNNNGNNTNSTNHSIKFGINKTNEKLEIIYNNEDNYNIISSKFLLKLKNGKLVFELKKEMDFSYV